MSMIETIKKAGLDAVCASNPVNILFGEVLSIENFKIKVDQKLVLDKDFFIVPQSLTKYEVDLSHNHDYEDNSGESTTKKQTEKSLKDKLVIREGLKQGDKVLLLRVQGGQRYIILDKVV